MFFKSLLACSLAAFVLVFADDIIIESPAAGSSISKNTEMKIKYYVQAGGMAQIRSASAKLVNDDTKKTVGSFPSVEWSPKSKHVEATWSIPGDLSPGSYSVIITGQATERSETKTLTEKSTFNIN